MTYHKGYGRGEPIRMLLSHANIPFENYELTQEEWPSFKPTTPGGILPILEYEGKVYDQTNAILRYLRGKFGYYPKHDNDQAFLCD